MHKELQAVFNEVDAPTHCAPRDFHDQMLPIDRAKAAMDRQVARYRELLSEAEHAPHQPLLDETIEELHHTLEALERDGRESSAWLRRYRADVAQWDRYAADLRRNIERAARGEPTDGPAAREARRQALMTSYRQSLPVAEPLAGSTAYADADAGAGAPASPGVS